ncbi:hypothetical protein [Anaerovibrio slackiae]|uniref:hypothetical protein n=1 Tax=Anaerovibrio slackiae TaxID=2652309 RepID=UPI003F17368D
MEVFVLEHAKQLGYPSVKKIAPIESSYIDAYRNQVDVFVSFRPIKGSVPFTRIRDVDACKRFLDCFYGDRLFYMIAEDSEFAPLILWDSAHSMNIGESVTIIGDASYYQKEYFVKSFLIMDRSEDYTTFKKISELPAEQDAGLDDWTFGIPVGPGDATALNGIVKRILELNCTHKEIILCGRPGDNFKYWSDVKVVGEDIPAPPVQICRKKNTIVEHAKYNNLCIIHDRVFLPRDFMEGMRRYGDYFGFLGLQSIYFGDSWNQKFVRYSDYCFINSTNNMFTEKAFFSGGGEYHFTHRYRSTFQKNAHFCCIANPRRYYGIRYLTGSLYICKKAVWEICPQDEKLVWEDYEDVLQGNEAYKKGIISTINPYIFSQSIFGRQTIIGFGCVNFENARRKISKSYYFFPIIHGIIKCHCNITKEVFVQNIRNFCKKYGVWELPKDLCKHEINATDRLQIIYYCILKASISVNKKAVNDFVLDIQKRLFQRTFTPEDTEYWYKRFCIYDSRRVKIELLKWELFMADLLLPGRKSVFADSIKDYFISKSFACKVFSFATALKLTFQNGNLFYHPDGVRGFYREILASTPWRSYVED